MPQRVRHRRFWPKAAIRSCAAPGPIRRVRAARL